MIIVLATVAMCTAEEVVPAAYPEAFSIRFDANVTADCTSPESESPVNARMFYDWSIKAQRVDHAGGTYECSHFYGTELPCKEYFLEKGL